MAQREERVTVMYMQRDRGKEGENKENGHRNYKEERRSFESWRLCFCLLFFFSWCGSNEEMK